MSTTFDAAAVRDVIVPLVNRFLTPEDVSLVLVLNTAQIFRRARRGAIPGALRVGRTWRFHAAPFAAWTRGWWDPDEAPFDAWLSQLQTDTDHAASLPPVADV